MSENKTQFKLRLADLNDRSIFINWDSQERERIFSKALSLMKLTDIAKLITYDLPTLSEVKNGSVKPSGYVYFSLYSLLNLKPNLMNLKISSRNYSFVKVLSPNISPELMGLLHSDGMLKKNKNKGINCFFCNQNKKLINHFKELVRSSFDCRFLEFKDKRDKTYYIHPPSIVGRILINRFGEKKGVFLPPLLSKSEIPGYIRGLFDGDGSIYFHKLKSGKSSRIQISMQNKSFAEKISLLLSLIGIYSRVQFETSNGNKWWNVDVARKESILKFINKINSSHPKKKKRMVFAKRNFKFPLANLPNISSVPRLVYQY